MSDRRRGDGSEKGLPGLPNLTEFAAPDLIRLTTNVVNTWSQVNNHLISFAQASLQSNLSAAEELRQVQSPKELVEVQLRIARKAYDEYLDEAAKLGEIVQKLSNDTMEALLARKQDVLPAQKAP